MWVSRETHQPRIVGIVQQFRFSFRFRRADESVSEFVATLRNPSAHCKFADGLSEMLRNRLVCGVSNEAMQLRLLVGTDLTFSKGPGNSSDHGDSHHKRIGFATVSESAVSQQGASPDRNQSRFNPQVLLMQEIWPQNAVQGCKWFKCGKVGHISPACRPQKAKSGQSSAREEKDSSAKSTREETLHVEAEVEYLMHYCQFRHSSLQGQCQGQWNLTEMGINTGASLSIINNKTFQVHASEAGYLGQPG